MSHFLSCIFLKRCLLDRYSIAANNTLHHSCFLTSYSMNFSNMIAYGSLKGGFPLSAKWYEQETLYCIVKSQTVLFGFSSCDFRTVSVFIVVTKSQNVGQIMGWSTHLSWWKIRHIVLASSRSSKEIVFRMQIFLVNYERWHRRRLNVLQWLHIADYGSIC